MTAPLAAVILAAGEGRRLRPLTELRPKPLCPVRNRPLLDHAFDRVTPHTGDGPTHVAVNAHHLWHQVVDHVGDRAHVTVEDELLGTAGAVGNLRQWITGRDVLLTNADSYLVPGASSLDALVSGRSDRVRLLAMRPGPGQRQDFTDPAGDPRGWRYIGACLLPWSTIGGLPAAPSGLYEVSWRDLAQQELLEFVEFDGLAVDCGTPADYLQANLAEGGQNVVAPTATVLGRISNCVVWDGAIVGPDEDLTRCIRAAGGGSQLTVPVRPS